MSGVDPILDGINFVAKGPRISAIPWPGGRTPTKPTSVPAELPEADILVWTYTRAEGEALADVFTPGHPLSAWVPYTTGWAEYESQLTWKSPARESKCLGQWALTEVAGKSVVLFRNELHLATDSKSLPLRQCWRQLIGAVKPSLIIDTGTAGGIGAGIVEGDCIVGERLRFDCQKMFAEEPWAKQAFSCTFDASAVNFTEAEGLMKVNAGLLRPEAARDPVVVRGDVLTTDEFAFDDARDSFGLRTYDPVARAVEMDAAVLGLVAGDLGVAMPPFISLRSASDPQMDGPSVEVEEKESSAVYLKYGYAAQVATLCAVWQIIAGVG